MTNLDSVLKSKDITWLTKVRIVKAMVFPVVTYGYERWTIKKADCWRNAFELWCWRRLLRVSQTARSNQLILKEINLEYSLVGLMLKRKLQYFGHQMRRTDSLEKTLMLGKTEGRRRRGQQRTRWLDGITDSMDKSLSRLGKWWGTRRPGVLQSMGSQRIGHSGWITTTNSLKGFPGDSMVKNLPVNAGDSASAPRSGRSPGGGNSYPLQYPCLENPMNRGAWWATVHKVTESDMTGWLSMSTSKPTLRKCKQIKQQRKF